MWSLQDPLFLPQDKRQNPSRTPTGQMEWFVSTGKWTQTTKESVTGCLQSDFSLHRFTTEGQYCGKREHWTKRRDTEGKLRTCTARLLMSSETVVSFLMHSPLMLLHRAGPGSPLKSGDTADAK
ncbi:hypothetical protein AAFF_G00402710 [Aldrovandia affinis]|uniref:Uncharacterized protein n=1 Tax=Aldrovandia affinis TaxID=143900 RepID=A0AAD7T7B7_9TELE|nr:hypothetical protein AAFF_G00402710 [Aldrovandia affinis]